jgi:hypothetical protein
MSTITAPAANPDMGPTLRDLAYQAASAAKLNSFADAYDANPEQANRIDATVSNDYPDAIRLANLCDSGLVNQMVFFLEVPGSCPKLAVLSCPFPTARGTGAVFAGSLGNTMDINCPVTSYSDERCQRTMYHASICKAKPDPIQSPNLGNRPTPQRRPRPCQRYLRGTTSQVRIVLVWTSRTHATNPVSFYFPRSSHLSVVTVSHPILKQQRPP